jgi:excisionase family DNA binding protein
VHDARYAPTGRKPRLAADGAAVWMTSAEVCRATGWTPEQVYRAVRCGQIPHCRTGRAIYFPRVAIQRWLAVEMPAAAGTGG